MSSVVIHLSRTWEHPAMGWLWVATQRARVEYSRKVAVHEALAQQTAVGHVVRRAVVKPDGVTHFFTCGR